MFFKVNTKNHPTNISISANAFYFALALNVVFLLPIITLSQESLAQGRKSQNNIVEPFEVVESIAQEITPTSSRRVFCYKSSTADKVIPGRIRRRRNRETRKRIQIFQPYEWQYNNRIERTKQRSGNSERRVARAIARYKKKLDGLTQLCGGTSNTPIPTPIPTEEPTIIASPTPQPIPPTLVPTIPSPMVPTETPTTVPTELATPTPTLTPIFTATSVPTAVPTVAPPAPPKPTLPNPKPPTNVNPQNNTKVLYADIIGGKGNDSIVGSKFTSKGNIVLALNSDANIDSQFKGLATLPNPNGNGYLVLTDGIGKETIKAIQLPGRVSDIAINKKNDTVVAVGNFGIVVYSQNLERIIWEKSIDSSRLYRVAINDSDNIVTLGDKIVSLYDNSGSFLVQKKINKSFVNDVAIANDGTAYAIGFINGRRNGVPVQIAFLHAYDGRNLERKWVTWDFPAQILGEDMADSRLYRMTLGETRNSKQMVYVLGESAGGNSIFRWNGKDLKSKTSVKFDRFNTPFNTRANHIAYYAIVEPSNGNVVRGQFFMARNNKNAGNTLRINKGDIAVDKSGTIMISGSSNGSFANRDKQTLNGIKIGNYGDPDPIFAIFTNDMKTRIRASGLIGRSGTKGFGNTVDMHDGVAIVGGSIYSNSSFTTGDARQKSAPDSGNSKVHDIFLGAISIYE